MAKPLLSVRELILESFQTFVRDWRMTLEASIWFLLPPILVLCGTWLSESPFFGPFGVAVLMLFGIAAIFITVWTHIRLAEVILAKNAKRAPTKETHIAISWPLFFSFIWVAILESLALFGGFFLFVIPGIWLAISLVFSRYLFLEDGLKGTQALAASAALVKGRWWATFWRIVIPGLLFLSLYIIALELVIGGIGLVIGFQKMDFIMNGAASAITPTISAIRYLIQSLGQVIFWPLFVTWIVKLFHSMKESR